MRKELTVQDYENGLAETGFVWAGVFNHRRTWKKTPDDILRVARDKAREVFIQDRGGTSHAIHWTVCLPHIIGLRVEYNGRLFRYTTATFEVDHCLIPAKQARKLAETAFTFWGREGYEWHKAESDNALALGGFPFAIIPDDACDMADGFSADNR